MSSATAVAVVLWTGATIYAVFGGADFGAGLWSLLAGRGDGARRPRELIDWAIGPVWEANHVWLIFVIVVLWTGFPSAFEAIFSTLFIPLSLAALGIVLRGSGRSTTPRVARAAERWRRRSSGWPRCSRPSSWVRSSARSQAAACPLATPRAIP
jgi:cytochrome d ubiquinol oxidase subunit II